MEYKYGLHEKETLTWEEIVEKLGLGVGQIRGKMNRALQKIRENYMNQ